MNKVLYCSSFEEDDIFTCHFKILHHQCKYFECINFKKFLIENFEKLINYKTKDFDNYKVKGEKIWQVPVMTKV